MNSGHVHGISISHRSRNHHCLEFCSHVCRRTGSPRITNDPHIHVQYALVFRSKCSLGRHKKKLATDSSHQSIIAAWTTYGTYRLNSDWSWRLPTILQALPAIINLIGLWFLPESPIWLVGQDRHEDARAILIKYHAGGDEDSAFVAAEFEEIRTALQLELAGSRS
jgi:hypothetical protein